jgi:peptide/nickel transport system permease protein
MSMRVGDESARARAEAIDPVIVPTAGGGGAGVGMEAGSGAGAWQRAGQWRIAVRRFRRHKLAMVGLGFLVVMFFACFVLVRFAPDPDAVNNTVPVEGPTASHWFGTDLIGRDSLSRVLHGGQNSLKVALGIAILSTLIGVVIGALAGFYGGWLDSLLMRFTDLWIALPAIPFLAVAVSIGTVDLGPFGSLDLGGLLGMTLLLSLLLWGSIARVVRGATLSLREQEFVDGARAIGASNTRIIVRHVIPNCVGPIIVNATLVVAEAILIESTLSFLGFGIQPPTPSWGNLLSDAIANTESYWWLTVFPGLAIFLTVLAVNFVGDGLRDALDPRRLTRA